MAQAVTVLSRTATVNTTDATATTIFTYTIPNASAVFVRAIVIAKTADGASSYSEEFTAGVNQSTGTAVLNGVKSLAGFLSSLLGTLLGLGSPTATITVSGSTVRVVVTGKASTALQWQTHVQLYLC